MSSPSPSPSPSGIQWSNLTTSNDTVPNRKVLSADCTIGTTTYTVTIKYASDILANKGIPDADQTMHKVLDVLTYADVGSISGHSFSFNVADINQSSIDAKPFDQVAPALQQTGKKIQDIFTRVINKMVSVQVQARPASTQPASKTNGKKTVNVSVEPKKATKAQSTPKVKLAKVDPGQGKGKKKTKTKVGRFIEVDRGDTSASESDDEKETSPVNRGAFADADKTDADAGNESDEDAGTDLESFPNQGSSTPATPSSSSSSSTSAKPTTSSTTTPTPKPLPNTTTTTTSTPPSTPATPSSSSSSSISAKPTPSTLQPPPPTTTSTATPPPTTTSSSSSSSSTPTPPTTTPKASTTTSSSSSSTTKLQQKPSPDDSGFESSKDTDG